MEESVRVIAIHEAGHAVIAVLEHKDLTKVTMQCTTVLETEEYTNNNYWGARVALAGFIAAYISSDDPDPLTHYRMQTGTDGGEEWRKVCRLVCQAMDPHPTKTEEDRVKTCINEQQQIVTGMLESHWPAVVNVANRLTTNGELTGDQVREIVFAPQSPTPSHDSPISI